VDIAVVKLSGILVLLDYYPRLRLQSEGGATHRRAGGMKDVANAM